MAPKPNKIQKCGLELLTTANTPFDAFIEIKKMNNDIEDGAIVTIQGSTCVDKKLHNYVWQSNPITTATDFVDGPQANRYYLKVTLTLTVTPTNDPCPAAKDKPLKPNTGPGDVTVTVTNDPNGAPNTSDPEDADPIYFP